MYGYVTEELENLFDHLNRIVFGGSLKIPKIRIYRSKTWKGWHVSRFGDQGLYEITINEMALQEKFEQIVIDMLHQMVHIYCAENGYIDTSRDMRYHNKTFKRYAEDFGLVTGQNSNGHVPCGIKKDLYKKIEEKMKGTAAIQRAFDMDKKAEPEKYEKTVQIVCPVCGAVATTGRKVSLLCVKCNQLMRLKK